MNLIQNSRHLICEIIILFPVQFSSIQFKCDEVIQLADIFEIAVIDSSISSVLICGNGLENAAALLG